MIRTKRRCHCRKRAGVLAMLGTLMLLAGPAHAAGDAAGRIERIELNADASSMKVVVTLSRPLAFDVKVLDGDAAKQRARRLVLDFPDTTLAPEAMKPIAVANALLQQIRPGQFTAKTARIVLDLASDATHTIDAFESPPHVTIALAGAATAGMPSRTDAGPPGAAVNAAPANEAPATVTGSPAEAPAAAGSAESRRRTIPIRGPGRKPYSLNYSR